MDKNQVRIYVKMRPNRNDQKSLKFESENH